MFGDPREACELALLAKAEALTTADGIPQTFRFVTREVIHLLDLQEGQLPACLLQMEEPEMIPHLSHVYEVMLPGRFVVAFPLSFALPASSANSYRLALERILIQDIHLGGLVDLVSLRGTLMPGLWEGTNLLGLGVLFSVLYEYDPREAALVV